jgi:hypothetical protein
MKEDYSKKEWEMIKKISPEWAKIVENDTVDIVITPIRLLEIIALECFMDDKKGKEVESLRRCLSAYKKNNINRGTEKYEKLIIM